MINNTKVIFKTQTQPPISYRIYSISKDGIHLGGSSIDGRFPWRNAQSVVRGIIRTWAQDLVTKHDAAQLTTILQRWTRDWSSNNNGGLPPLENILSSLIDNRIKHKAYFGQIYGARDGSVISHLSEEMTKAIGYYLKIIGVRPMIQWKVDSLLNCARIYRILLEGGDHCEG